MQPPPMQPGAMPVYPYGMPPGYPQPMPPQPQGEIYDRLIIPEGRLLPFPGARKRAKGKKKSGIRPA